MTGALGKSILTLNASMRSNSAALLRATAEPANLVGTEVSGYSDRGLTGRGLLPQRPPNCRMRAAPNASSSSGSPGHVGGELFKYMTGTRLKTNTLSFLSTPTP